MCKSKCCICLGAIFIALLSFTYYVGLWQQIIAYPSYLPKSIFFYKSVQVPYFKLGPVFEQVYNDLAQLQLKTEDIVFTSIYYDDPKTLPKDTYPRSDIGVSFPPDFNNKLLLKKLRLLNYQEATLPEARVLQTYMPVTIEASFLVNIIKAYPVLEKASKEMEGYSHSPFVEVMRKGCIYTSLIRDDMANEYMVTKLAKPTTI
jgi:hypothetical protein